MEIRHHAWPRLLASGVRKMIAAVDSTYLLALRDALCSLLLVILWFWELHHDLQAIEPADIIAQLQAMLTTGCQRQVCCTGC